MSPIKLSLFNRDDDAEESVEIDDQRHVWVGSAGIESSWIPLFFAFQDNATWP